MESGINRSILISWFVGKCSFSVNAPLNVVQSLQDVLCSSRDGVPLGPKKDTCRQDSLSKWID